MLRQTSEIHALLNVNEHYELTHTLGSEFETVPNWLTGVRREISQIY
jgi:hypothetical protein